MSARHLEELTQGLRTGASAEVVESLLSAVSPDVDLTPEALSKLAECMRKAADVIDKKAKMRAYIKAGVPPGVPALFNGFYFEGCMTELQRAMIQRLDTRSKGRLACVSKYWQEAVMHPAFWLTLYLPPIPWPRQDENFRKWLQPRTDQFYGTKRLVFPVGNTRNEDVVILRDVLKACPALTELDFRKYLQSYSRYRANDDKKAVVQDLLSVVSKSQVEKLILWDKAFDIMPYHGDDLPKHITCTPVSFSLHIVQKNGETELHTDMMWHPSSWVRVSTWGMPELRVLELFFLPWGTMYQEDSDEAEVKVKYTGEASVADVVRAIVQCSPKLKTFKVCDDYGTTPSVLDIDVAGVRARTQPSDYPIKAYNDFLAAHRKPRQWM